MSQAFLQLSTTFTAGNATALSTHSAKGCYIPGEPPLLRGRRPQQIQYVCYMIGAGAAEHYHSNLAPQRDCGPKRLNLFVVHCTETYIKGPFKITCPRNESALRNGFFKAIILLLHCCMET